MTPLTRLQDNSHRLGASQRISPKEVVHCFPWVSMDKTNESSILNWIRMVYDVYIYILIFTILEIILLLLLPPPTFDKSFSLKHAISHQ